MVLPPLGVDLRRGHFRAAPSIGRHGRFPPPKSAPTPVHGAEAERRGRFRGVGGDPAGGGKAKAKKKGRDGGFGGGGILIVRRR